MATELIDALQKHVDKYGNNHVGLDDEASGYVSFLDVGTPVNCEVGNVFTLTWDNDKGSLEILGDADTGKPV